MAVSLRSGMAGTLFCDFDGTVTDLDFYELVLTGMDPQLDGDPLGAFRRGELPLFETLRRIFAAIPLREAEVVAMLPRLRPDPELAGDFARLHAAGWTLHLVSAGCAWYVERTLEQAGVDVPVAIHANPGRFEGGLIMERHPDARISRAGIGIDKAEVVRRFGEGSIAFAGNSEPDAAAARAVPAQLRFARGTLRDVLDAESLAYRPFDRFHEVANALLA